MGERSPHSPRRDDPPSEIPSMHAPPRAARAFVPGELSGRDPRSSAGRTRGGSRGTRRTGRCASDGIRSRVLMRRISRRAECLPQARPLASRRSYPHLSVSGFGFTECPLAPSIAFERSDRVAIGTDQLAFRDLGEDLLLRAARPRSADVAEFLESWQVIPLHHLWIENPPAISARSSGLQAAQPRATRDWIDRPRRAGNPSADLRLVMRVTHLGGAIPAIDLQPVRVPPTSIESRVRLDRPAPGTPFHVFVQDRIPVLSLKIKPQAMDRALV